MPKKPPAKKPAAKKTAKRPAAKKPARKAASKPKAKPKPKVRKKPAPPPPPEPRVREPKLRCHNCLHLTPESDLRWLYGDLRCSDCRVFWYVATVHPEVHEETAARNLRQRAKEKGITALKEVVVPRTLVIEVTKTTWRVWRDEKARKNGWKIPDDERDPEVLKEFGLLGVIAADTEDEARDAARYRFPNDFDRVVEPHNEGGKPRPVRRVKFPGYIIIRCEYTDDVHLMIEGLRGKGIMGLLPPRPGLLKFRYPKKQPRVRVNPTLDDIKSHAFWSPTPMDTQAEVESLLAEKAALKALPKAKTPEASFPENTRVKIVGGQWKDTCGVVKGVKRTEEEGSKFVVEIPVFGRPICVNVEPWQIIKEN